MYMSTQANLDYWSTDNCCVCVSLRHGTVAIGLLSTVWQSIVITVAMMALTQCKFPPTTQQPNTNTTTYVNGTINSTLNISQFLEAPLITTFPAYNGDEIYNATLWNTTVEEEFEGFLNATEDDGCLWIPNAQRESFKIYDKYTLTLVVGIVLSFSCTYWILSALVIIGVIRESPRLLQGWVLCTALYMFLTMADLLVTLPFTTLTHMLSCITQFVVALYTWAVVKSYMHALKVARTKGSIIDSEDQDYTVDGVDLHQDAVEV